MTAFPCFAFCGKPACKSLGCIRVYNDRGGDWMPDDDQPTSGVQDFTLALCVRRWSWWPQGWPLGTRWMLYEKQTEEAEVQRFARGLRDAGAIHVSYSAKVGAQ